jgi:hypothetical protein
MSELRPASIYLDGKRIGALESFKYEVAGAEVPLSSLTLKDKPFFEKLGEPITVEFDCSVAVGIREARALFTGRPRPKRAVTKVWNKETRELRRALVGLAGWHRVQSDEQIRTGAEIAQLCFPFARRTSVPRSLRAALGLFIGGSK